MDTLKIIYTDKELLKQAKAGVGVTDTTIGIDTTDHFSIICSACMKVMPVMKVILTEGNVLHIIAFCTTCEKQAQRKIWFKNTDPICITAPLPGKLVFLHRNERIDMNIEKSKSIEKGDYKTKLKKAAFQCLRCDALTIVDQEIDSGEVITPFKCENDACGRHGPYKLVVEKSSFIEI